MSESPLSSSGVSQRKRAWAARQGLRGLGAVGRLRWAGVPEPVLQRLTWELYRQKNGLEARTVLALAMMPPGAPEASRADFSLRQLLSPAYVALAGFLVDPETPSQVRARVRAELLSRSYLPGEADAERWAEEARWCLEELKARRSRWDVEVAAERAERAKRGARRKERLAKAASRPRDPSRLTPSEMRAYFLFIVKGKEITEEMAARLLAKLGPRPEKTLESH